MKHHLIESIRAGKPLLGLCIMYPSPGVIERIGPDWDWLWLDGQHGEISGYQDLLSLVRACDLIGKPAVVRVPSHEPGLIALVLDMGASGVMVPVVESVEQAAAVVRAAKFPPLGNRSYGGRRVIDLHGRNYSDTANADTLLIAQLESDDALKKADEIAAIPGIDALMFGPDDVFLRRGFTMTAPRPEEMINQDLKTVSNACRKHNKIMVSLGMNPEMIRQALAQDCHMIVSGGDVPFLASSSTAAAKMARVATDTSSAVPAESKKKKATSVGSLY